MYKTLFIHTPQHFGKEAIKIAIMKKRLPLRHALLSLLLGSLCVSYQLNAQIYQGDGRLLYGTDIANNANGNAAEINPAILGGTKVTSSSFNLLQVGFNGFSNAFNRGELLDFMFSDDSIPRIRRDEIVDNLVNDKGRFQFEGNIDINWVSFSWTKPGFGGLAFHLSDKIFSNVDVAPGLSDVLFIGSEADALDPLNEDGVQLSEEGTSKINYNHIRELSITYGRQAYETDKWKLNVGANYRILWGVGHFDSTVEGTEVTEGNSSFSEFYQVNYGNLDSLFTNLSQNLFATSGSGQSFSFGVNLDFEDKFHFGISALNLGKVSWDENVLTTKEEADIRDIDTSNTGYDSYSFSEEFGDVTDALGFEETEESFESGSRGKIRVNANYQLTAAMKTYFDIIFPVGSSDKARFATSYIVGVDYAVIPDAFHASTGFHYSRESGLRIPLGVSVAIGKKGFLSISTGDLRTLFNKNIDEPFNSLSIALVGVNTSGNTSEPTEENDGLGWLER